MTDKHYIGSHLEESEQERPTLTYAFWLTVIGIISVFIAFALSLAYVIFIEGRRIVADQFVVALLPILAVTTVLIGSYLGIATSKAARRETEEASLEADASTRFALGLPEESTTLRGSRQRGNAYRAALRATAPLFPIVAMVTTLLLYFLVGETSEAYPVVSGDFAVIIGFVAAILIWTVTAIPYRRYTTAKSVSLPNYHQITEAVDYLKYRIDCVFPDGDVTKTVDNGLDEVSKREAYAVVRGEIEEIENRLEKADTAWVTGAGYIELWHRIHRAQEAMIKLEPISEVAEGAMRDGERLRDSNIANKDQLLSRLTWAAAVLDSSESGELISNLIEQERLPSQVERGDPQVREKALATLVEIRYEIDNFRDNAFEGLVTARNQLASTSVVLGLHVYALLSFAIFAGASRNAVEWATIYFLIGALAGLYVRARGGWNALSAVDDFGLTTARLLHTLWLAGSAAVGGVLISSAVYGQFAGNLQQGDATLATIFESNPINFVIAAVFGLALELIFRLLTRQQVDEYKADLRSVETSRSIHTVHSL